VEIQKDTRSTKLVAKMIERVWSLNFSFELSAILLVAREKAVRWHEGKVIFTL